MATVLEIGRRRVGPGQPAYVIAEVSANHHQRLEAAEALVRAAAASGADAVKLQTYTADTMTIDADTEWFTIRGTIWNGRTLHELYREACTPWEWHAPLARLAASLGLDLFSTPFDATAVDFLEAQQVPAYKIASFEVVDIPLLRRVAATGKPVIMSTGMATRDEIDEAVKTLRTHGCRELALLKCTSAYPAAPEEMDLRTIPDMMARWDLPVGVSDHTLDSTVPVIAVALGGCIVEKHITASRTVPGPDSAFSLEPNEFAAMVAAVRVAEAALGSVNYDVSPREQASRAFRRSLFVVEDVRAGEVLTPGNVRVIRPAGGLHPRHLDEVMGRRAARDLVKGTPLAWDLLQ